MSRREAAAQERSDELAPEHRRRWLVRTVVTVVVVLAVMAGGPWTYARFFAPEPAEPLGLTVPTPEVTELAVSPSVPVAELDGSWVVSAGSEAGFRLGEVLSGNQVTVVGRTDEVSGELVVADGTVTTGEVVVDVASIATDEAARDAYFRRAIDTTTYPEARFVLEQPIDIGDVAEMSTPVAVAAEGSLTMHGLTVPVTAQLEVQRGADGVEVVGSIPVVLADFDLSAPDLGFVTVEPSGLVELRLLLTQ